MRLVLASLTRPFTTLVIVLAVLLCSVLAVRRMPADIFPQVGDPVIYVAQPYGGMDAAQMEGYLTYYYEYHFLYITGIDHVESRSIQGAALMKLVFHPDTNMSQAMAETVGYVNRARAFMPPGTVPPFITRFDAGSVAIGQLVFSSPTRTTAEMQDVAINLVRPLFATLPGVSAPPPFGGNQRTIVITLDPDRLAQYRISPEQAIQAVNKSSVVMPSGNMYTGILNRVARTNAALGGDLSELLSTPIRPAAGTTVYLRDIGSIENGTDIVTAYAHVNGKRTVYIPVTKRSDASTLAVIDRVRAAIPDFKRVVPGDVDVRLEFDQSGYVTNAIKGLISEGVLGAVLTGLAVLIFLRDWRSALIVVINIPCALFAAVVALWVTGQTINIMTLGGLALAVGVLVDEATVEIENIHREMTPGKSRARAVVDACSRTAAARLLSMLCILAVFVPSFFMVGVARQLFVPLSLAVAFAMAASYLLSTTLVPVLSAWLMKEADWREMQEGVFGRLRQNYQRAVGRVVKAHRLVVPIYFIASAALLWFLIPRLGVEIFPDAQSRLLRIRLRAPVGTRIEETERIVLKALRAIQDEAGADRISATTDFIGVQPPSYPVNLIHLFTSGPQEAVLQISLKPGSQGGEVLREQLRDRLHRELPDTRVSFEAGDIIGQVMSFGSPTPVEIAVQGPDLSADTQQAERLRKELARLPFLRDLQIAQELSYPSLDINIDRDRAGQFGLTMADVVHSVVPVTSSSRFTDPNYWRDPKTGNAFQIQVQLPQNRLQSVQAVGEIPVMRDGATQPQLSDVATLRPGIIPGLLQRYNGQRVVSLTANLHDIPLGQAAASIRRAISRAGAPPKNVTVRLAGQIPPLEQTVNGLKTGLLIAVLAVFLILVASFQSFRLAACILLTIPAVFCGVVALLLLTGTTLNIQSFMGAIMAIGIAVANSILLITFAERSRREGASIEDAAAQGATGRFRAILMTASAMICGMIPMAIGLSEAGSQTAPLGRAVIGGLLVSTVATLLILPALYAALQAKMAPASPSLNPDDPNSRYYEAQ